MSSGIDVQEVRQAIQKAQQALWAAQRPDGAWQGENYGGPAYTGMLLVVEHRLGVLDRRDAGEATRWLRAQAREDGSFPAYPFAASGSFMATACVSAGLVAAGVDQADPVVQRARRYLDAAGGPGAADPVTRLFLVMAGVLPPDALPAVPAVLTLVPGASRVLGTVLTGEIILVLNAVLGLGRGLRAPAGAPHWLRGPVRALADRRVIGYLSERQNPAGDWLGVFPSTVLGMACLHALGVPISDPRLVRALGAVKRWKVHDASGLHVLPFTGELWDTACTVRALLGSGVAWDHPGIRRAVSYLLGQQGRTPVPADLQNPRAGAPRAGGWPFEEGNEFGPDCDTTAAVLVALSAAAGPAGRQDPALQQALSAGLAWLMAMQDPDGGWAAFSYGHREKRPGPMPIREWKAGAGIRDLVEFLRDPPVGFADPSSEELTGRVLSALAPLGYTRIHPRIARAIDFVVRQRTPEGTWWGRWNVNYLSATATIVSGLKAVGENMNAPYVREALRWLHLRQNQDGGWGETVESYLQPELAGVGPSTPGLSALVLSALLDAGGEAAAIERGVRYLLSQQQAGGRWEDRCCLRVVQPPVVYYHDPLYPIYASLRVLDQYLRQAQRLAAAA